MARIFGRPSQEALPLYNAVVTRARAPHWYLEGQVPDTVDGRFDMIAAILSIIAIRLEADESAATANAMLTERFVDDMDGQLRELGIGDVVVGKHIGKMMSMLGGRIGAYRDGLKAGEIDAALVRNLYRGTKPDDAALAHVATLLTGFSAALAVTPTATIIAGDLP